MIYFRRFTGYVAYVTSNGKTIRLPLGMDVSALPDESTIYIGYTNQFAKVKTATPVKINWKDIAFPVARSRDDMVYELRKLFLEVDEATPTTQVQSDWTEADTESLAFIKNKPVIPDPVDPYDYWTIRDGLKRIVEYGALYNQWAVSGSGDSSITSSNDWKHPTSGEVNTLITYLGGTLLAGGYIKETGLMYWNTPNTGATNSSKFGLRGGGYRLTNGSFADIKDMASIAYFNTSYSNYEAYRFYYNSEGRSSNYSHNKTGLNIRLIKASTTLSHGEEGTYTGNDGKAYKTICIGTQEWLAENLIETKYRNGDTIPIVTDNAAWAALETGAMCYYDNDPDYGYTEVDNDFEVNDKEILKIEVENLEKELIKVGDIVTLKITGKDFSGFLSDTIAFTDKDDQAHSVVIENGLIKSWAIT